MIRHQRTFNKTEPKPTIYLVGTPIGNLGDLSPRAQEVLRNVNYIFCEDTRTTDKLLSHYKISNKLISCHKFNEQARLEKLQAVLSAGQSIALVSDAGAPMVSDPGGLIVEEILKLMPNQVNVSAVNVGPAYLHALLMSGTNLPYHFFYGFLKNRGSIAKHNELKTVLDSTPAQTAIIFYESVHRVKDTIDLLNKLLPAKTKVTIARELTKSFEEVISGPINEVTEFVKTNLVEKGEFVIIVAKEQSFAKPWTDERIVEAVQELMDGGESLKTASILVAREANLAKNHVYQLAIEAKKN